MLHVVLIEKSPQKLKLRKRFNLPTSEKYSLSFLKTVQNFLTLKLGFTFGELTLLFGESLLCNSPR
ncbi:MAG: hypothetical protein CMF70_10405 [Magnetovibrio sp.]|nr:hypothetical protein [Magnetovibrio sp.]